MRLGKPLQVRAPRVRAPDREQPAHWAPAAHFWEHSGTSDRVSGARTLGRPRTRTATDSEVLQGGSPAAWARLTRCLCQGFSFAPWGSISAGVANCCSVASTSTSFLFLAFFPPKASYAQIEGVVLSQNFNVFDAGWFQAIIYLFRDYWFLLILSEGPQSQSGATLARGVGKSWEGTVTPAAQRGLCIQKCSLNFRKATSWLMALPKRDLPRAYQLTSQACLRSAINKHFKDVVVRCH